MSFSSDVKKELARQLGKARHCQLAELAGILMMDGFYEADKNILGLMTDNVILQDKYKLLLKELFFIEEAENLSSEDMDRIFRALKYSKENSISQTLGKCSTSGMLLKRRCCKRAFLRGTFMASGSISDPRKSYHFEIVCTSVEQAIQLVEIMKDFEADAKIVERKGHFVVYLKEGSQIVDMLNVMEAYVALMNLENVRILKEISNSVNRKVNCETANINKTVSAAVKQVADIEYIKAHMDLKDLPKNLKDMAIVRLENPEAPLKELGEYLEPPVGKSGVNHRLRKLGEIADELRERYSF